MKETVEDLVVDTLDDYLTTCSVGDDNDLPFVGRIYVPNADNLKKRVMDEALKFRLSIHSGGNKIYHDMKRAFWLSGKK